MFLLCLLWISPSYGWTLLSSDLLGWSARRLEVYVNATNCTVDESTLHARVDEALEAWNRTPYAAIQVARAAQASTQTVEQYFAGTATLVPVILCDTNFGNVNAVDPDGVPASTRVSTASSRIHYAGIMLNAQAGTDAEISKLTETELRVTLAHEMGHVLGLGHSSEEEALMYYSISGKDSLVLAQDDADGLTYLYPRNEFTHEPFGVSCQAVHGSAARPISMAWALFFLLGNLGLGRLVFCRGRRGAVLIPERLL